MANGYNFTERVRKVLRMAREEALRLSHPYVGTEHILLGIIAEGEGVASTILQNLDVDPDDLRARIEAVVKRGTAQTREDVPYTSPAKKVLELSMAEARQLAHSYVGTEHLLLGLLREEKGIAAQALVAVGVTLELARVETLRILGAEMPIDSRTAARREAPRSVAPAVSDRVDLVSSDAESVAGELGATDVTPLHVAIALLRHREGIANAALRLLSVDRHAVLRELEALANSVAPATTREVPLRRSDGFQNVLAAARTATDNGPGKTFDTGDLLVALLDNAPDVAAVFAAHSLTAARLRDELPHMRG